MSYRRRLKTWEIAVFSLVWAVAQVTMGVAAAVVFKMATGNDIAGWAAYFWLLALSPLDCWERSCWNTVKANRR